MGLCLCIPDKLCLHDPGSIRNPAVAWPFERHIILFEQLATDHRTILLLERRAELLYLLIGFHLADPVFDPAAAAFHPCQHIHCGHCAAGPVLHAAHAAAESLRQPERGGLVHPEQLAIGADDRLCTVIPPIMVCDRPFHSIFHPSFLQFTVRTRPGRLGATSFFPDLNLGAV